MPGPAVKRVRLAGPVLAAVLALLASPAALAFRCGKVLVSEGDSKAEVLIKCGAPDWKTQWSEDFVGGPYPFLSSEKERWLYNLGPQRFMRILLFEDGRLSAVNTGERGFSEGGDAGACDLDHFDPGISDFLVQRRCGAPAFIDTRYKEFLLPFRGGPARLVRKRIEEWTYNLGPTQFLRILVFENGELVERRSGDRGFVEEAR
ncbi:MAG: DUF2845 domain-containing protein [Gammaproteobacteria bacterium]|nr:DUF2845 domain-containing protein [Gammaproteobacteria bacterium]